MAPANNNVIAFIEKSIHKHWYIGWIILQVLAIRLINSSPSSSDLLLNAAIVARSTKNTNNPQARIFYTTDGTDPRAPDGTPSATATELASGSTFNVSENVRVIARNFDETTERVTKLGSYEQTGVLPSSTISL